MKLLNLINILLLILLSSCNANNHKESENVTKYDTLKKSTISINLPEKKLTVQVFKIDNGSFFGFDIYEDNKKIIRQGIIPCLSGNRNFLSKNDAEAVGNLMVMKIKNGTFPPSITKHDLDSIGIK